MAERNTKYVLTAEDRTKQVFDSFAGNAQRVDNAVLGLGSSLTGLFGAATAGGFLAFVRSAAEAQDELGKLSQRVGVSVEGLAALKYAGALADVSLEDLGTAIKKLSVGMADAQRNTGDAKDAFKALGISIENSSGQLKPTERVIEELADKFADMEDGAGKTAIAVKIFGRAGSDLIPLLNGGAAGLRAAADEAKRFGVLVGQDAAKAAEEFNDNITRLATIGQGLKLAVANSVIPAMNDWIAANIEAYKIAGSVTEALRLFVFNLDAMTTEKPREEINRLTEALQKYQQASALGKFAQSPTGFIFGGREEDLKKQIELLRFLERQEALARGRELGGDTPGERARAAAAAGQKNKAPKLADESELRKMEQLVGRFRDQMRKLEEDARRALGIDRSKVDEINELLAGKEWEKLPAAMKEQLRDMAARVDKEKEFIRLLREEIEVQEQADREKSEALSFVAEMQKKLKMREGFENIYGEGRLEGIATEDLEAMHRAQLEAIDSMQEILDMQARLYAGFDENGNAVEKRIDEITEFWRSAAEQTQQAWADLFFNVMEGNIQQMDRQFATFINRIVANALAAKAATAVFGPNFEGGGLLDKGLGYLGEIFGGLFGGARAGGGPVSRGRAYLVGEEGPEIIVPRQAGYVIPNDALGGGRGVTIGSIHIAVPAQPGRSFGDTGRQIADALVMRLARV